MFCKVDLSQLVDCDFLVNFNIGTWGTGFALPLDPLAHKCNIIDVLRANLELGLLMGNHRVFELGVPDHKQVIDMQADDTAWAVSIRIISCKGVQ